MLRLDSEVKVSAVQADFYFCDESEAAGAGLSVDEKFWAELLGSVLLKRNAIFQKLTLYQRRVPRREGCTKKSASTKRVVRSVVSTPAGTARAENPLDVCRRIGTHQVSWSRARGSVPGA